MLSVLQLNTFINRCNKAVCKHAVLVVGLTVATNMHAKWHYFKILSTGLRNQENVFLFVPHLRRGNGRGLHTHLHFFM